MRVKNAIPLIACTVGSHASAPRNDQEQKHGGSAIVKTGVVPTTLTINPAAGDRDVNMGMPVEPPAVCMDGADNTDIQPAFSGGVQQIIDSQTAEVVKQPAVDLKQGPERVGQGEDEVYPVAVRQAVKLGGNSQVCGFFTAGGAGTAVAGVGDVFYMPATGIIAAIFLHAGDAGTAGEHFGDGFDLNIAQTACIEKRGPAVVSRKESFKRAWSKTRQHGAD